MAGTPQSSRVAGILVVGVAATALTGCANYVPNRLDFSDTEPVKITEIVIGSGHGDVTVKTSATTATTIKRTVRYHGDEPSRTYQLQGTVLHVDTACGENCTVDYEIEVPTDVSVRGELGSGNIDLSGISAVDVTVSSGDIRVSGATGEVRAESGSGDITVTAPAGPTRLVAASGTITGRGLGRADVNADAASGDIDLELTRPGSVTAHTSSGNLSVRVPDGRYRIRAAADSGDARVSVPNDTGASAVLDLTADSGDVAVARR